MATNAAVFQAQRSKLCDLSLAPRGLVPIPDGQFAARTATGIAVMSPSHSTHKQTLLPALPNTPCAVLSFDPELNNAVWVSIEGNGRVVIHRTLTATKEVLCVLPTATAVYCVNTFVIVTLDSGDVRFYAVSPGLLRASEDCAIEAVDLGAATAAAESIGLALSTAATESQVAVAMFAQVEAELRFDVIRLSRGAPAAVSWRGSVELPDQDPPVNWAVSASGEAVCVLPKAGYAPLIINASGKCTPLEAVLPGTTNRVRDVVDTAGDGFAFVSRLSTTNDEVSIHSISTTPHIALVATAQLQGVTLGKATSMTLAVPPSPQTSAVTSAVLVGRSIYAFPIACAAVQHGHAPATQADDEVAKTQRGTAVKGTTPASTVNSLASLLAAKTAPKPDHALTTQQIIAAARTTGKWPASAEVLRDTGVGSSGAHDVVDALLHDKDATALHSYLRHCRDVSATTILYSLSRLFAAAAAPTPKRKVSSTTTSDAPPILTADHLKWAAAIINAAADGAPAANRLRGSLHGAWRSRTPQPHDAANVFRCAYGVALHAISVGRLSAFELCVKVMDAVTVSDVEQLQQSCPVELSRALALVDGIGAWALSEPGMRLGQLTAHSGPVLTATKEAQVVPDLAYRIPTATSIAVHRERYPV